MHLEWFKNPNFSYPLESDTPSPGPRILGGGIAAGKKEKNFYNIRKIIIKGGGLSKNAPKDYGCLIIKNFLPRGRGRQKLLPT